MRLRGGIIQHGNDDALAVIMMLATARIDDIEYRRYAHYHEFDPAQALDFVVLGHPDAIPGFIQHCQAKNAQPPQIILLAHPDRINRQEVQKCFPDVPIAFVPQACLDELDVTLNFEIFYTILDGLRELKQMKVPAAK